MGVAAERERSVLIVDAREISRELVGAELQKAGCRVVSASDADEGWAAFESQCFDLVVTHLRAPDADGMMLLRRIRSSESRNARAPVIMLSALGTLSAALDAGRAGATDFLPFSDSGMEQLLTRVEELLDGSSPELPEPLIGESRAIAKVRSRLIALANLSTPVLIHGERGTGRDSAALYLHRMDRRAGRAFTKLPCRSGSPPSGVPKRGTVYLDDVDRLPKEAQQSWRQQLSKLAGMGGSASIRVIASTTLDPSMLADDGGFDRELADGLARFRVKLPPLRERSEDLGPLVAALLRRVGMRLGRCGVHLTPAAHGRLKRCPWHRNVSDLERVLESLVAYTDGGRICASQVDAVLADLETPLGLISRRRARGERELLLALYRKHGTYSGVARELGITRNAAKYRFAKHDLLPSRSPTS